MNRPRRSHGEVGEWVGKEVAAARRTATATILSFVGACFGYAVALRVADSRGAEGPVVLLGVALLGLFSLYQAWLLLRPRYWPEAPCEIVHSSVQEGVSSLRYGRVSHSPFVVFEFEVDGVVHRGRRIALVHAALGLGQAHDVAAQYEVGAELTCRYPPGHPERAVLTSKSDPGPLVLGVAGAVLLIAVFLWN